MECDVRDAEVTVQGAGGSVIMEGMKDDTADPIRLLALRETPLSLDEVHAAVGDTSAGGTVVFVGTVRDHDGGKDVAALEYSAHPSAEQELRRVAEKVVADFPVVALAAVHRVGALQITDAADSSTTSSTPCRSGSTSASPTAPRSGSRPAEVPSPGWRSRRGAGMPVGIGP
jgi:hypothetical protein